MNVIKVTFDIDIDNNEQLGAFNNFVGALKVNGGAVQVTASVKDIKQKIEATPAKAAEATAQIEAKPETTDLKKLEVIRSKMGPKLGTHRDTIKAKLTEFNAPNLTELPVDRWVEFEQFIDGLA